MTIKDLQNNCIAVITSPNNMKGRCVYRVKGDVYWITGGTYDIHLPENDTWNNVNIEILGRLAE